MISLRSIVVVLILALAPFAGFSQTWEDEAFPPKPGKSQTYSPENSYVKEWKTDILSASEEKQLHMKLYNYEDSTSTQIAVVVTHSLFGQQASAYAAELGERWGVGQKGKDNGVLLLVAPNDREYFIASGYGVEGALPDGVLGSIGRTHLVPAFRQERYASGINGAVDEMMLRLSGEYEAGPEKEVPFWVKLIPVLIVILIVILIIKFGNKGGGNFTNMDRSGRRFGRYGSPWIFPTGGSRGGFGGGGGSFGGGGFGGFGGGGFGGGGAGGSW